MAVYTAVLSGTISDSDEFEFLSGVLDDVGATAVPPADSPFESNGGGAAILAEAFNTSMYDMDANSRTPTLRIWFDGQWDILIEAAGALQIALTVSACNAEGVASGPARHWSANGGYDYDPDGGVKFMSEAEAFASLSDVRLHASVELAKDLEAFLRDQKITIVKQKDARLQEKNFIQQTLFNAKNFIQQTFFSEKSMSDKKSVKEDSKLKNNKTIFTAVLSGTIGDSDDFEKLSITLDNIGATAAPPADSPFESGSGGAAILTKAFNTSMYDMDANSRTPTLRIWFDGQWDDLVMAAEFLSITLTVSACNAEGVATGPARQWSNSAGYNSDEGVEFVSEAEALASLFDTHLRPSAELAKKIEPSRHNQKCKQRSVRIKEENSIKNFMHSAKLMAGKNAVTVDLAFMKNKDLQHIVVISCKQNTNEFHHLRLLDHKIWDAVFNWLNKHIGTGEWSTEWRGHGSYPNRTFLFRTDYAMKKFINYWIIGGR